MMDSKIIQFVLDYFNAYGYYLVFFFLLAENSFFLGLVIPGDAILLLAAFLAANGNLDLTTILFVGIAAAVIGNNVGYFLGREGGRRLLERVSSKWLSPEKIAAAEKYFDEHGQTTVFVGRFVAGVRTFVPVLAGASKMSYPVFLAYTVASVVVWTVGIGILGYFFGENFDILLNIIERAQIGILIGVLAIVFLILVRKWRRRVGEADSRSRDS